MDDALLSTSTSGGSDIVIDDDESSISSPEGTVNAASQIPEYSFTISSDEELILSSPEHGMDAETAEGSVGSLRFWSSANLASDHRGDNNRCLLCGVATNVDGESQFPSRTVTLETCSSHLFHVECLSQILQNATSSTETAVRPDYYRGSALALKFRCPHGCFRFKNQGNFWIFNGSENQFMPVPVDYEVQKIRGDGNIIWPRPPISLEMVKGVAKMTDLADFVFQCTMMIQKGGYRAIVFRGTRTGLEQDDPDLAVSDALVELPDKDFSALGFVRNLAKMFDHETCVRVDATCHFFFDVDDAARFRDDQNWA